MPNRTIYIRKEDLPKWEELKDKSEQISKLLNSSDTVASKLEKCAKCNKYQCECKGVSDV